MGWPVTQRRWRRLEPLPQAPASEARRVPLALPAWLRTPAPSEPSADPFLRPSDPADDQGAGIRSAESAELRARALLRGVGSRLPGAV